MQIFKYQLYFFNMYKSCIYYHLIGLIVFFLYYQFFITTIQNQLYLVILMLPGKLGTSITPAQD